MPTFEMNDRTKYEYYSNNTAIQSNVMCVAFEVAWPFFSIKILPVSRQIMYYLLAYEFVVVNQVSIETDKSTLEMMHFFSLSNVCVCVLFFLRF